MAADEAVCAGQTWVFCCACLDVDPVVRLGASSEGTLGTSREVQEAQERKGRAIKSRIRSFVILVQGK